MWWWPQPGCGAGPGAIWEARRGPRGWRVGAGKKGTPRRACPRFCPRWCGPRAYGPQCSPPRLRAPRLTRELWAATQDGRKRSAWERVGCECSQLFGAELSPAGRGRAPAGGAGTGGIGVLRARAGPRGARGQGGVEGSLSAKAAGCPGGTRVLRAEAAPPRAFRAGD